jgi:hypothetical protein
MPHCPGCLSIQEVMHLGRRRLTAPSVRSIALVRGEGASIPRCCLELRAIPATLRFQESEKRTTGSLLLASMPDAPASNDQRRKWRRLCLACSTLAQSSLASCRGLPPQSVGPIRSLNRSLQSRKQPRVAAAEPPRAGASQVGGAVCP